MPVKSNEHHNPLKWNSWNKQWKNMLLNYIFERIEMLSTNCLHAVAPQTNNETYTYNTYVHKAPLRHLNEWIFRCRDYIRRLPCTANFLAAVHTRDVTRGARLWCASATVHNLLWFCCDIYIYAICIELEPQTHFIAASWAVVALSSSNSSVSSHHREKALSNNLAIYFGRRTHLCMEYLLLNLKWMDKIALTSALCVCAHAGYHTVYTCRAMRHIIMLEAMRFLINYSHINVRLALNFNSLARCG